VRIYVASHANAGWRTINIRRQIKEAAEKLEKEKKINEDEKKRTVDEPEKNTHSETKKIEDPSAAKEKEILEVK